jgi:VWFA-related protein
MARWHEGTKTILLGSLVVLVVTLATFMVVRAQQDTGQRFRTEASLVRVDIYPITDDGQAVTDLTADDFEVREDNTPQSIATFEHVVVPQANVTDARPEPTSLTASRALASGERARILVVFLDTFHTDARSARAIHQPLVRLLDGALGPDDVIAFMTPEMSVRDLTFSRKASGVERALARFHEWARRDMDRMRDPDEERYEGCFPEHGAAACPDPTDPRGSRTVREDAPYRGVAREMVERRREQRVLAALTDLTRTLEALNEGRKAVLAVSSGWLLPKENLRLARLGRCDSAPGVGTVGTTPGGRVTTNKESIADAADQTICEADRRRLSQLDLQYEFKRMLDGANRANVSFYPIDARGLAGLDNLGATRTQSPSADTVRVGDRVESLRTLAESTDGLAVVNTNDLAGGVGRLLSDLTSYYLIGYYSTNTKADGGYRRITVSAKRRGVTVRARRGYRAITAGEIERQRTEAARAGQTLAGGVTAVQAAVDGLAQLRPTMSIRTRVAYAPSGAGHVRIWAVAEIDSTTSREGAWLGGGTVDAALSGADNRALASAEGAMAGNQRTVLLDLGQVEVPETGTSLRVRLQPAGEGPPLRDVVALAPIGAAGDPGVPLLMRRGATTGTRFVPTADPHFRRTERVRLELPRASPPGTFTAVLLDRAGGPLPLPVATATRTEGSITWATAEVSLAPLAHGDYVIKLTVDGIEAVTAIRVVP